MPIVRMPGTPIQEVYRWLDWSRWHREGKRIMYVKNSNEPVWIDRDRVIYRLSEIPDSHLQHIERWLMGRGAEDIPARKRAYDSGWYDIVRDELERRNLELLPDHKDAFDEKVTKRTGDQSAAMAQRYKEIMLAERGLTDYYKAQGYGYILDPTFNDEGLDGHDHELAGEGTPGWDSEYYPDKGRDF